MKVHEECSCGAVFDADDGRADASWSTPSDIQRFGAKTFHVQTLAADWRANHIHTDEPLVSEARAHADLAALKALRSVQETEDRS